MPGILYLQYVRKSHFIKYPKLPTIEIVECEVRFGSSVHFIVLI
jgi:hypothetical protein